MMEFDVIGRQALAELLGDSAPAGGSSGGLDATFLSNAAAELLNRGVQTEQNKKTAQASSKNDADTLSKAQSADGNWAAALVALDQAQQGKDAQAISAATVLSQSAQSQVLTVGTGLSDAGKKKRLQSAQDNAQRAASDSLNSPSDKVKMAKMKAWQQVASTVAALAGGAAALPGMPGADSAIDKHGGGHGGSFLTRNYAGVPAWGWGVGGAGILTGLIMLIRHFKKGK
jgi:hypothetical protein